MQDFCLEPVLHRTVCQIDSGCCSKEFPSTQHTHTQNLLAVSELALLKSALCRCELVGEFQVLFQTAAAAQLKHCHQLQAD